MTKPIIPILSDLPAPPDYQLHSKEDYSFTEIWKLIGTKMFHNKILGYKGNFNLDLENSVQSAVTLNDQLNRVKEYILSNNFNLMQPKATWQFFKTKIVDENLLIVEKSSNEVLQSFIFPRQNKGKKLCLIDYLNPKADSIAFYACTSGNKVSELANIWIDEGRYQDSFILQGLALATAEALAEFVHKEIRSSWGFPDRFNITLEEIMLAKYRGCRYSFGYPACPNLEDQKKLWQLLRPERIKMELTEGYMMDPEASVSALVFHHPEAKYFSV
ncbi:MAG: Methionine synthase [Candidatus Heimdallarchaeota archaeon LC_3]|nr:MAG: Methionine synthase [Candidatus Heimdallarchaeota archaeon LC_3]